MYRTILAALAVISSVTQATPDGYDKQLDRLQTLLSVESLGSSRDYWIATINAFGDKEFVGLVFGMADDLAFCHEVMDVYRDRYPNNRFFCEPAN